MRSIVLPAVLFFVACNWSEQPYRFYSTYGEAVEAGEVERGWLPEWVPQAAQKIHLQADLDTNQTWLRFELPAPAKAALEPQLTPLTPTEIQQLEWRKPARGRAWWPRNLIQQQQADDTALNAALYAIDGIRASRYVVAIDRSGSEIFVTSVPP